MKSVKNIGTTDLEIGFEGLDYTFPAGKAVACEDEVGDFIKERCPLFEVERLSVGKEGDKVPRIEKKPTKVYSAPENKESMVVNRREVNDTEMPGEPKGIDADGVEWIGPGLEKDTLV